MRGKHRKTSKSVLPNPSRYQEEEDLSSLVGEKGEFLLSWNVGETMTSADVVNSIRSSALRSIPVAMIAICSRFACCALFVLRCLPLRLNDPYQPDLS